MQNKEKYYIVSYLFFAVCLYVGVSAIIGSSYLGLQGQHIWRQSEVLAHTFGFMNLPDFRPFDRFVLGANKIYDIPIYQFLIAKISLLFDTDPLVITRHVNFWIWIITGIFGARFCLIYREGFARYVFLLLYVTSPLYLHYFAVPLPDNLSLCLSIVGLTMLMEPKRSVFFALIPLAIATIIKSPIPFSFIVFFIIIALFGSEDKVSSRLKNNRFKYILILVMLFLSAVLAEWVRKKMSGEQGQKVFAQDPFWYFGSLQQRLDPLFWKFMWSRIQLSFGFYFAPMFVLFFALHTVVRKSKKSIYCMLAASIAYLTSWMVFTNVYFEHDYYQIPVMFLLMLAFAVGVSSFLDLYFSSKPILKKENFLVYAILVFSLIVLVKPSTQKSLSNKKRTSVFTSMEYMLKKDDVFLYVGNMFPGPIIGGLLQKKFASVSVEEFEKNCTSYLKKHRNIVTMGYVSPCLHINQHAAKTLFQDGIYTLYKRHPLARPKNFVAPSIDKNVPFSFHPYQTHITLSKPSCSITDTFLPYRFKAYVKNEAGAFELVDDRGISFIEKGMLTPQVCKIYFPIAKPYWGKIKKIEIGQMDRNRSFTWKMDVVL